jgi:hypothetical protein
MQDLQHLSNKMVRDEIASWIQTVGAEKRWIFVGPYISGAAAGAN